MQQGTFLAFYQLDIDMAGWRVVGGVSHNILLFIIYSGIDCNHCRAINLQSSSSSSLGQARNKPAQALKEGLSLYDPGLHLATRLHKTSAEMLKSDWSDYLSLHSRVAYNALVSPQFLHCLV